MSKSGPKPKQFCKRNHDILICGRDSSGMCRECKNKAGRERTLRLSIGKVKKRSGRHKAQFCKYGHDTAICGRDKKNVCNDCKRDWALENSDYYREYFQENKEALTKANREWCLSHPEATRAFSIKNQTNRNLRVVSWTDWNNIKEFYRNKPKDMAGDHYIPLQGDGIAGLHVSWNLQYLSKPENSSKYNKCDKLSASEWYGKILEKAGLK